MVINFIVALARMFFISFLRIFEQQYISVKKQFIVIMSMYFFLTENTFTEPGIDETPPVPLPIVPPRQASAFSDMEAKS